jgi:hypothetical protein
MAQLPPPPPPQNLWAFKPFYAQPLPAPLNFNPQTDFLNLVNWAAALAPSADPPRVKPVAVIATYPRGQDKKAEIAATSTQAEQAAAEAGVVLSSAKSHWPAKQPVVGVVVSRLSSAVDLQEGRNDWHAVAMARDGDTVWVHDPEYSLYSEYASSAPEYRRRVALVPGTRMVQALIQEWNGVKGVWFQGPPDAFTQDQQQCMGRSALWVEQTLNGTLPWPPNTPGTGGTWTFHHKN